MPMLKNVERKIEEVEGFRVEFFYGGVNVRDDKENIPQYPYMVAAVESWSVAEWTLNRFKQVYPSYDVRVYTKLGMIAAGNMKLSTVRGKN